MIKSLFITLFICLTFIDSSRANELFNFLGKIKLPEISLKNPNARICSNVDLRSKFGEVRNQGLGGWCFAYTAADLVSFKLGQKISAVDMSINFYQKMPEMPKSNFLSEAAGGSDIGSLTYIMKEGFCSEENLTSETIILPKECNQNKTIHVFTALKFIEITPDPRTSSGQCQIAVAGAIFKNVDKKTVYQIMTEDRLSSFEKIIALKEKNCADQRISAKGITMKQGMNSGFNSLIDIDQQLSSGEGNPVSLNYNSNFLLQNPDLNVVGNHYSSIIGRRMNENTQTCQYLIRNSWGKDCSIYPHPYNKQCEDGNVWVDEDVLGKNIISVRYLK